MADLIGGLFMGVPIFIAVGFVVVGSVIVWAIAKAIGQWSYNNAQPIQSAPATMVAKRTETSGGMNDTSVSTLHYATFEHADGTRQEFGLSGRDYGLLAEHDTGTLSWQGTRYKGFVRGA